MPRKTRVKEKKYRAITELIRTRDGRTTVETWPPSPLVFEAGGDKEAIEIAREHQRWLNDPKQDRWGHVYQLSADSVYVVKNLFRIDQEEIAVRVNIP